MKEAKNQNLEALRGVMALMVIVTHIALLRMYFGRSNDYLHPLVYQLGRVALTGFFVLSGYLITLSLLQKGPLKVQSIGDYYIGRVFRILPVYYGILFLAIVVLPRCTALHFIIPPFATDARVATENYHYFLWLMPQVPLLHNTLLPFAEPGWSIGVELLFYFVIPWLIVAAKEKLQTVLMLFLILFLTAKYIAIFYYRLPLLSDTATFFKYYRYDGIALGCLMGVLHFKKSTLFSGVNTIHFLVSIIVLCLLFTVVTVSSYDYFLFAVCFAVIIAFLANTKALISPKWLVYLGTISYSLYLTHEIVIVYLINMNLDTQSMPLMYVLSTALAILLASIVHFTIEKPFMRWGSLVIKKRAQ